MSFTDSVAEQVRDGVGVTPTEQDSQRLIYPVNGDERMIVSVFRSEVIVTLQEVIDAAKPKQPENVGHVVTIARFYPTEMGAGPERDAIVAYIQSWLI